MMCPLVKNGNELMPTDLAQAEAQIRASLEQTDLIRSDAVRSGALDLNLANALKAFDEARVQFVLAGIRLDNEKVERPNILAAAGYSLGSAWANALTFALGANERMILNGWVRQALEEHIGPQAAGKTIDAVLPRETEPVDLETATPEGTA